MNSELINILNFFQAIRIHGFWTVGFELLLIGLFVYSVVRFLRGTRGARMLKGIGFVLVVFYLIVTLIAKEYKLERIQFLYGKLLLFASFATVVVFQPEIRRALMRLGETRLFRNWSTEVSDDVDVLVESAAFCSKMKIGALVAIEREIGLGGIAESGTRLDAELSAPLLNTIFFPNTPLHDLGVIVSGGRIAYAGVQFPLAESGELERELGSRHRAAVGMSQESDAIVLVVSEETGDISIADRGRLHRKLTLDQLRRMIKDLISHRAVTDAPTEQKPVVYHEAQPTIH